MKKQAIITIVITSVALIFTIVAASVMPIDGEYTAYRYVKNLGWDIDKEPIEKQEVSIPPTLDDVYLQYNDIQKQAGFDLQNYKGKTVMRYTFLIKNYYDIQDVRANVLVYKNKVIGGDIMTVAINGFMEPLHMR